MNGPEHYAKAEECFAESDRGGPSYEDAGLWLELGVGHALLAIAAALGQQLADRYRGDGDHVNAWYPTWTPTPEPPAEPAEQPTGHVHAGYPIDPAVFIKNDGHGDVKQETGLDEPAEAEKDAFEEWGPA